MANRRIKEILNQINNDPELLAIYETGFIGQEEPVPQPKPFTPCYGTQSFQQDNHTYQFEIVSTSDGSVRHTGRVS